MTIANCVCGNSASLLRCDGYYIVACDANDNASEYCWRGPERVRTSTAIRCWNIVMSHVREKSVDESDILVGLS